MMIEEEVIVNLDQAEVKREAKEAEVRIEENIIIVGAEDTEEVHTLENIEITEEEDLVAPLPQVLHPHPVEAAAVAILPLTPNRKESLKKERLKSLSKILNYPTNPDIGMFIHISKGKRVKQRNKMHPSFSGMASNGSHVPSQSSI